MRTKKEIVENWLPRYTGTELKDFGEYILLVNFGAYLETFARLNNVPIQGRDRSMPSATAGNITMIRFGMGSANAATVMDLLSAINPVACLFLGKCGGLKHINAFLDYYTGTVYTTNRRVWEHDEEFKQYLQSTRAMAIDLETATIFTVGFANAISTGALLLVSDQPMISTGVKTEQSDKMVTEKYMEQHVQIGVESLQQLIEKRVTVKHLKF